MLERKFAQRQWRFAGLASGAGLIGYLAVVVFVWLLRQFDDSGAALGFLVPFGLSIAVVAALVLGSALPARVLGVEWPLAIGGAFSAHATTVVLALAVEFYVGYGAPYALAIAAGFGAFIRFGVAPRLEINRSRLIWLSLLSVAFSLLAWLVPDPVLVLPGVAWIVLPMLVAMWDVEWG